MSFNSLEFALFLPVFLLVYHANREKSKFRDRILLVGSYIFYMSWYWQYAGLIALSTLVDYKIGVELGRSSNAKIRKILLGVSLGLNLGLLVLFKYFDFFAESAATTMRFLGLQTDPITLALILPVGISFYTFQTLSYTIDRYRQEIDVEHSFLKFATFVSFFPQLVAGPIVRASFFLPQLHVGEIITQTRTKIGLRLIFIGLFKKIVLADLLALLIVDGVFSNPEAFSSADLLIGLYAYAFQIYCDFSGYSDIAIGVALLLGFRLPTNFNKPYLATSPSDFWRRWHISLSEWLRDYVYVPLGGNRRGPIRTYICLLITMLLGGLWHGAAWNFVLWGGYHGLLLLATRKWPRFPTGSITFKRTIYTLVTFHMVLVGWLLFRVPDMETLMQFGSGIANLSFDSRISALGLAILSLAAISHILPSHSVERVEELLPVFIRSPIVSLTQVAMILLFVGASVGAPAFIYFQF